MLEVDVHLQLGAFQLAARFEAGDETLVLFGHSGSGKSLALASIAGLRRPDAGRIAIDGHVVFDSARGIDLPPQHRGTGYVVQHLALFPHLTVAENIAYGLGALSRGDRARRVAQLIDLFGLGGLEGRLPANTSGGQQQRVALARALARPTAVLLLDEPFSALDEALRRDLRLELTRLRGEYGVPLVFVTHDLREAHLLGDRVAVLDHGRVLQCDDRDTVFQHPTSSRVAELTGVANIFSGIASGATVEVAGLALRPGATPPPGPVAVAIRAERCNLRRLDPSSALPENCFVATITRELAFGNTHTLHLTPDGPGPSIEVEVASRPYEVLGVAARRQWVVELPPADLHVRPPRASVSGREASRPSGHLPLISGDGARRSSSSPSPSGREPALSLTKGQGEGSGPPAPYRVRWQGQGAGRPPADALAYRGRKVRTPPDRVPANGRAA